jgi:hypothetical protein
MIQAIVQLFGNGEAAAIQAHALCEEGWSVVVSGPNAGTDVQIGAAQPTAHNEGWVLLASKSGIETVC